MAENVYVVDDYVDEDYFEADSNLVRLPAGQGYTRPFVNTARPGTDNTTRPLQCDTSRPPRC